LAEVPITRPRMRAVDPLILVTSLGWVEARVRTNGGDGDVVPATLVLMLVGLLTGVGRVGLFALAPNDGEEKIVLAAARRGDLPGFGLALVPAATVPGSGG
jgi:hypothetical protein